MSSEELTTAEHLKLLDAVAVDHAPRLFAIYGVFRSDNTPTIGWGMDFGEGLGALTYFPDESATWRSSSAERTLESNQIIGEMRLRWLPSPT
ncbi:hypothetical protein F0L68_32670 [Solihabitans fulvus]|uniref:Uncharacterized protein n=1 Tax=Solihabitans fulvus TaxID=1892852 RepID=A0A5B2WNJ9_9PSEU|nr:hypothetical protein [Solihabitans fulvus]KAA2253563.1 hypothetical protein F0L68_32670 [Solihabitans fulvus]